MIRVAAKAVIIKDGKLLVLKNYKEKVYYTLPGGGQNHKEDLRQALKRECREEIGADVEVKDLLFVSEYIASRHQDTIHEEGFQQTDMFFKCNLMEAVSLEYATETDVTQTGIEWLDIDDLEDIILYPMKLRAHIKSLNEGRPTQIYLGEVG